MKVHVPVEWCRHRGVAEVELGIIDQVRLRRLSGQHEPSPARISIDRPVSLLEQSCARSSRSRVSPLSRRCHSAPFDILRTDLAGGEQQVALVDPLAVPEVGFLQVTSTCATSLGLERRGIARELQIVGHRLDGRFRHDHLRRRRHVLVLPVARGQQHRRQRDGHEPKGSPMRGDR